MTDREFFVETIAEELPRFEKVFKAVPADKLDYTPHEKSKKALDLVTSTAMEAATIPMFLEMGAVDFDKLPPAALPKTVEESWKVFAKALEGAKTKASSMSEEDWGSEAKIVSGNKEMWKTTKGRMVWSFLFDLIHHRGQLSTYLRPMGGKVPSIYGPSGDSME